MTVSVELPEHLGLTDLGVRSQEHLLELLSVVVGHPVDDRYEGALRVGEVAYDLPALTTRSRHRIRGVLQQGGTREHIAVFVKVVQSWALTPEFQFVPPAFRTAAAAGLPWRVEPGVYASDLAQALPAGLRMPRTYAVLELDADAAAIWMEDVEPVSEAGWTLEESAAAARALGAFAVSPHVATALRVIESDIAGLDLRQYVSGRVALRLEPMLRAEQVWQHPGVTAHFALLRPRIIDLLDRLPRLLDELETLPAGLCHGDACTRNLLRHPDGGPLTLIDFGFVRHAPLGCDLGQLIFGEIQLGERPAADIAALWTTCTQAYLQGLADQGYDADPVAVRRAAVLSMAIFNAIAAVPMEELHRWTTPTGEAFFASRAAVAAFVLDQLDLDTAEVRPPAPSPTPAAAT